MPIEARGFGPLTGSSESGFQSEQFEPCKNRFSSGRATGEDMPFPLPATAYLDDPKISESRWQRAYSAEPTREKERSPRLELCAKPLPPRLGCRTAIDVSAHTLVRSGTRHVYLQRGQGRGLRTQIWGVLTCGQHADRESKEDRVDARAFTCQGSNCRLRGTPESGRTYAPTR